MKELEKLIRDVPDFPKEGIIFKDITTLLQNAEGWKTTIDAMVDKCRGMRIDKVLGIEARGFAVAGPVAYILNAGFILARKPGKLPARTRRMEYSLEYGTATIEVHEDAIEPGERILILDDLLATGGTVEAAAKLVESLGGKVAGIGFIIELAFLNGRDKVADYPCFSLITV
ncbi:adenine phosphoribosyltransferase [bacterium]|nr:adenine phosphoribosyltransferase [candidate division CSSED10-310 bacterium]